MRRSVFPLFLAALLLLPGAGSSQSAREPTKKERFAALPEDERKWLTEFVAPIILPEERKLFLELTESYQWEIFKQEFWARRENQKLSPPLGPGYKMRYEEL